MINMVKYVLENMNQTIFTVFVELVVNNGLIADLLVSIVLITDSW